MRGHYTLYSFHQVIRAMLAASGLAEAELSVFAGLHSDVVSKMLMTAMQPIDVAAPVRSRISALRAIRLKYAAYIPGLKEAA